MWADDLPPANTPLLEALAFALVDDPAPACQPSPDEFALLAAAVAERYQIVDLTGLDTSAGGGPSRVIPIGQARRRAYVTPRA